MTKKLIFKLIFLNVFLIFGALNVYALDPVLYFTDLSSGPNTGNGDGLGSGAIVTIWGSNLGISQGSSTVQIGSFPTDHVYCWGNADGTFNPGTCGGPAALNNNYQKMQAISFSIPSGVPNGATTISVTVGGATSNTLSFTVRPGRICYVKTTGTDAPGSCSFASPFKTLLYMTNVNDGRLQAGDIVYAMNGTDNAGGWWFHNTGYAEPAYPIFFTVYPGHLVSIVGADDGSGGSCMGMDSTDPIPNNVQFSKFRCRIYGGQAIHPPANTRFIANEVTGLINPVGGCPLNGQTGMIGGGNLFNYTGWDDNLTALGNYVHDAGCGTPSTSLISKEQHVFYFTNRTGVTLRAGELGWNYLNNAGAYHALHTYDEGACGGWSGKIRYHDNVVVNQLGAGATYGLNCSVNYNTPMDIYNNLFINVGYDTLHNKQVGAGGHNQVFGIGGALTSLSVVNIYNNTIYGFGDDIANGSYPAGGILLQRANSLVSNPACSPVTVNFNNNIIVDTHGSPWQYYFDNNCNTPPTSHTNNIWFSTVGGMNPPAWDTSPITTNPYLSSPIAGTTNNLVVGGTYLLSAKSPINKGINTSPIVIYDIRGISRTLPGKSYDIGAYQYNSSGVPSPPAALTVK